MVTIEKNGYSIREAASLISDAIGRDAIETHKTLRGWATAGIVRGKANSKSRTAPKFYFRNEVIRLAVIFQLRDSIGIKKSFVKALFDSEYCNTGGLKLTHFKIGKYLAVVYLKTLSKDKKIFLNSPHMVVMPAYGTTENIDAIIVPINVIFEPLFRGFRELHRVRSRASK